jgi:hypothetical protein
MSLYFSVAVWISIALVHATLAQLRNREPRVHHAVNTGAGRAD